VLHAVLLLPCAVQAVGATGMAGEKLLEDWGLKVQPDMMKIPARILPAPQVSPSAPLPLCAPGEPLCSLPLCASTPLALYPSASLPLCLSALLPLCPSALLPLGPSAFLPSCPSAPLPLCLSVPLLGCSLAHCPMLTPPPPA